MIGVILGAFFSGLIANRVGLKFEKGPKAGNITRIIAAIIGGALFFGVLVNEFIPREWFLAPLKHIHAGEHAHGILPQWLQVASGILLGGLIINALYRKYISRYFRKKKTANNSEITSFQINPAMKNMKIIVKGMTCSHCEATIENGIRSLEGIESAKADQVSERVDLTGEHIDLDRIREKVEGLGYKYGGLVI